MSRRRARDRRGSGRPSGGALPPWARSDATEVVEHDGHLVEVRTIQPYQATKAYLCPGCANDVVAGLRHVVVVPIAEPDDRRHWHSSCWVRRATRRPR